jgi:CheY-like chemotaxis protein
MKKVLIIEDDHIIANVYRNKLVVDGYQAECATDGEAGLKMMRTFKPDTIIVDLMLPKMSGIEVIKQIRSEAEFARTPIIVFSNTYLTNMIQEAWKAGATKCLSKSNSSPKEVIEVVRLTIGDSGAVPLAQPAPFGTHEQKTAPASSGIQSDADFQAGLRKTFLDSLPATLNSLRAELFSLIKATDETTRLKEINELYGGVHVLNGNAGLAGFIHIAQMSAALEALLKELYEKPKNINPSTLRTVAAAVDFLGLLFARGPLSEKQEMPVTKILVVDDEVISRRAVVYALEKAQLQSVSIEDPNNALKLLTEENFDLIFLDVDMPGMTGYELCTKLRALPQHKKTPVVFVTSLNDFDNRTSSTMAGGNDFIAKPFLFIELTVKALIHILRGKSPTGK